MDATHRLILILALSGFFSATEGVLPAEMGQPARDKARNLAVMLVFFLFGGLIAVFMTDSVPMPTRPRGNGDVALQAFSVLLFIFAYDLIFYWYHRAQHRFEFFWRIHELHHSDARMNATTSLRTHWLENPLQTLLIAVPASYAVNTTFDAAYASVFIMTCWLYFAHANLRLELGRLTPVACGPQLHRIHHSVRPEHRNKNFAQFFPVIDMLFGTYHAPAPGEFPPTGTAEMPSDVTLGVAFSHPFLAWLKH